MSTPINPPLQPARHADPQTGPTAGWSADPLTDPYLSTEDSDAETVLWSDGAGPADAVQ